MKISGRHCEASQDLNMNDEFKYIFTLINYFPNLSFESLFVI